uniref:Uncharacterized protein n=1 Tax=Arundo donax TaxID=35708 RepID=A0A0A8ZTF3_ARUDO
MQASHIHLDFNVPWRKPDK